MIQKELLENNIWCPNILDESIIVYLNLGMMVLLTDGKHPYLLYLNPKVGSNYLSPYKLHPIIAEEVIFSSYQDQFGNKRIKWQNQYAQIIPINTNFRDKLEHAINLNMFKH